MSPLPAPPPLPESINLGDLSLGVAIGSASWMVRYLCSTEKHSLGYIARRVATAGLTSLLVGSAVKGYLSSDSIAFAAAGAAGYASPELVDYALAWLRKHAGKSKTPPKD